MGKIIPKKENKTKTVHTQNACPNVIIKKIQQRSRLYVFF
jgi:hypothetical protein